jgi:hypothetical protein
MLAAIQWTNASDALEFRHRSVKVRCAEQDVVHLRLQLERPRTAPV